MKPSNRQIFTYVSPFGTTAKNAAQEARRSLLTRVVVPVSSPGIYGNTVLLAVRVTLVAVPVGVLHH